MEKIMGEDLITASISKFIDEGSLVGAITLIWQDGKEIHSAGLGWRNMEEKLPMRRDTVFRVASMTKPITSTLALMLLDEGHFALNDPITKWAPEFSQMHVLHSPTSESIRQIQQNEQSPLK